MQAGTTRGGGLLCGEHAPPASPYGTTMTVQFGSSAERHPEPAEAEKRTRAGEFFSPPHRGGSGLTRLLTKSQSGRLRTATTAGAVGLPRAHRQRVCSENGGGMVPSPSLAAGPLVPRADAWLSGGDFARSRAGRSLAPRRPAKRGSRLSFRALRRLRPRSRPAAPHRPCNPHVPRLRAARRPTRTT